MKTAKVKDAILNEVPLPWFAKEFANDPTPFETFRTARKNYNGCTRINKDTGISLFDEDLNIPELDKVIQTIS
tara:strand:- start:37 stop:255 length:219 start_codon:yes stop_codon:yes gene_type:complete